MVTNIQCRDQSIGEWLFFSRGLRVGSCAAIARQRVGGASVGQKAALIAMTQRFLTDLFGEGLDLFRDFSRYSLLGRRILCRLE